MNSTIFNHNLLRITYLHSGAKLTDESTNLAGCSGVTIMSNSRANVATTGASPYYVDSGKSTTHRKNLHEMYGGISR